MMLGAFQYERPASLDEALRQAAAVPGARWLAGGMSLLPLMKMELADPPALVDLAGVADLVGVQEDGGALRVGAMTRHAELAEHPLVARHAPLLAAAASQVGDPQVRHRGTIGGSLAHADPAADLPAAVLALDATIEVASPRGRREIPAKDFFLGPLMTALEPDDVIVAVVVPQRGAHRQAYHKRPHPASGYAVVGIAASVLREADRVASAAIAVTGVASHAFRARRAEELLTGQVMTDALLAEVASVVASGQEVWGDLYASADYRRHLAGLTTRQVLERLWDDR